MFLNACFALWKWMRMKSLPLKTENDPLRNSFTLKDHIHGFEWYIMLPILKIVYFRSLLIIIQCIQMCVSLSIIHPQWCQFSLLGPMWKLNDALISKQSSQFVFAKLPFTTVLTRHFSNRAGQGPPGAPLTFERHKSVWATICIDQLGWERQTERADKVNN